MRITQIHILGEYKNLKDFKLEFDGKSFIDVFVGKNGTGKSNLFEAVIEIFRHLFERDYIIPFEYLLKYEIDGKSIEIDWKKEKLFFGGKETKAIPKEFLPDDIILYYSGHNSRITDLVFQYEENFKKTLKEANEGEVREFIGIGREYKALLLAVLLLQTDGNKTKEFIRKKLGINTIGSQLKIVLKRPFYARKKGYEIDRVDKATSYWKAEGITRKFLDLLETIKPAKAKEGVREEGYFVRDEFADEYILYFDIPDFQNKFRKLSAQQLFREFDNLKTIEMLGDISIDIKLENGTEATINHFSDGQFQTVYIYSIIELFKDRNCITLLDEPDSFLHPEWQFDFLKQVFEITEQATPSNHILMSSHSAVTLLNSQERKINLFELRENKIVNYKVDKPYAISQLSSKLIRVHQDEQTLSVIHTIGQNKPILFTEGYSDPVILQHAWTQLYDYEIPFEICFGHGCLYLRLLLQSDKLLGEMGAFPVFGLFDFDMAYNEWHSIKGETDSLLEDNPYKGIIKKVRDKNSYAILVPIPNIPEITKQVIKKDKETYEGNSKVEMEHLFYSAETSKHFHKVSIVGGGEIIEISDSLKMKFASEVVTGLEKKHFEVLRPMFDFILSKC